MDMGTTRGRLSLHEMFMARCTHILKTALHMYVNTRQRSRLSLW